MALNKRTETIVTILEDGQLNVAVDTIIEEDGIILSRSRHRHVVEPDVDENDIDNPRVKKIAESLWDKETKDKYKIDKKKRIDEARTRIIIP